ncbi:MAG TPA: hypothetical protein PKH72_00340 [Rhodoferax sp.]|jgi:magnesium transporter|nr:hypothetical protein [Rhodoferax sp.]HNV58077.1 hypothetical protein [Rhodoferax sp.]HPW28202.1 hypothetical protein [Rhodoferax sp.]
MMTQGIPWPLAFGGFLLGAVVLGALTYVALKHFETRRARPRAQ